MRYRVVKPLQYFHIGAEMDIDPTTKLHSCLISEGILEPVEKKPKASKRETKVIKPSEAKRNERQDD